MSGAGPGRPIALALAVALVVAACLTDAPEPSAAPSATLEPEATPVVTSYGLDTTVWYGGLVLTFGTATSRLDEKGGPIEVDVLIANPGEAEAELGGPIRLAAGAAAIEPTRETVLPVVPAGGTATAIVTFEVDGAFDVPAAGIRVGRDSEHNAIVPLVAGPEAPAVTLEPLVAEIEGEHRIGALAIQLDRIELRADLPDWSAELPRETMALTVFYFATFRSDFAGGAAFTTDNVALVLPTGVTVQPRRDGHSHTIALLRPFRRNTLATRFEVPAPGPGTYALVVNDGNGQQASLLFTIPAP